MTGLKPCPFCGRIPVMEDCGDNSYFVRCKCGIAQDKLYAQRSYAIKRWNTRKNGWVSDKTAVPTVEYDESGNWMSDKCLLLFADGHCDVGIYNPIGVFEDWGSEDGPLFVGSLDADDDSLRVISWVPLDRIGK